MPDPALDVPMRRTAPSPAHAELARTCQAGILTGHVRTSLAVLGLRLATPRLRPVLALLRPSVKSAARQLAEVEAFHDRGRPGTALVNVALSAAALRRLPGELPADRAFRAGMKHRQEAALGDPPVESWEPAYRQDLDVLVVVGAAGTRAVTRRVTAIRRQLRPGELVVVERSRQLDAPPGAVEHFGFVDGLSQPVFVTDDGPPAHGWDSRTPLANVLAPEPGPSGAPRHHGSYLVYRKIEQDTAAFARREAQLTALLGGAAPPGSDVPDAGAWLVGRHRDGTPLVSHATAAGPAAGAAAFDYHDDRDGDRCPLHAHVRKMNPRQSSDGPDDERRRLFPRRGQTYGRRRLRADGSFADLPATGVGLLFLAFNASITEQFEHVQAVWAENAGFPSLGSSDGAIDPIIGQSPPAPARLPSAWGATGRVDVPAGEPVTRLLGGEYFYAPSLPLLARLAGA